MYFHNRIGPETLQMWIDQWMDDFWGEAKLKQLKEIGENTT